MTSYLLEYTNIFIFIICSFSLSLILLAVVFLISYTSKVNLRNPQHMNVGLTHFQKQVFLLKSIRRYCYLFLLFDIEVLYLFPLTSSLHCVYLSDLVVFLGFYMLLFFGLLFEISRGVIDLQTK